LHAGLFEGITSRIKAIERAASGSRNDDCFSRISAPDSAE